ncbi:hypothetical protein [Streptomyces europaeiscabiei]|nr:hypothetical protein [Streptomyces europaeiscabiei]MDX3665004.1 hypothetical protein [Streptomyces europaeiscabiei]
MPRTARLFDALTRPQRRQLRDIGWRIWQTVAPDDHGLLPPS